MKAISLWQPWATLVAIGAKKYETRSWATPYRGSLIIHASKRLYLEEKQLCWTQPFKSVLDSAGIDHYNKLPLGAYLCVVDLVEIIPAKNIFHSLDLQERAFGNYAYDRYAWRLENVRVFPEPVPARGYQGFWNPLEGAGPAMVKLINDLYGSTK